MNDVVFTATNVSVQRSGIDVVQDISVTLHRGAVLAIVGPNGAGKTTFMKAMLNLIPSRGSITWARGIKIGYVPQKISISRSFPLTVREFFLLKSKKSFWFHKKENKNTWLDRVGGGHLADKKMSELSGGELQRVLIAYALQGDTDVLCLDEPSAGIDIGGGKTVYGLLSDLRTDHGKTIIIISHDLDVVFRYADEVLCIDKHQICHGRPASVLTAETIERMYGTHASLFSHNHEHHEHA
ncbi:MAG: metal ABC transporter ATP-binding protein [Candidatus Magasanikbacteria bacterium]|nr:metal ABC transporter ATP-binding protein [Candidatus Magasanikbacteria bacterium]